MSVHFLKHYKNGFPHDCRLCGASFKDTAWRGADGHLYCDEFCESDANECKLLRETARARGLS